MQLSAGELDCARELIDAFPPVMWFIRRKMRTFRRGLSVPQFRALVFVEKNPSASVSSVADHLGASMPTTSRVLATLARRGLIIRKSCANDRRQQSLKLTPRGQTVLKAAWQATERDLADELGKLNASERSNICRSMQSLKSIFGSLNNGRSDVTR